MFAAQNFHLLASFSNLISVIVPIAVIDDLLAAYIFCNSLDQTIKKKIGTKRTMKTKLRNDVAGHLTVLLPPGRH